MIDFWAFLFDLRVMSAVDVALECIVGGLTKNAPEDTTKRRE